ncbi:MAG: GTP-binding protein HSR1-related protein [bacterium]|nr:MAG: GTP-binding protein HSR1-related protein [bacterium]
MQKARSWVNGYATTGGVVAGVAIIPGATTAALFMLEITMVLHIGRIYRGNKFSKEDAIAVAGAAKFAGTIGLGAKIAMEGLTFLPFIGWAIKGGIAASVIKALGEVIIKYFESIE